MSRWTVPLLFLLIGALAGSFIAGPVLYGDNTPTPVYPKELTSYRDVVKRVLPAVVSVESHFKPKKVTQRPANPGNRFELPDQVPEEFRKFFEEFQRRQLEAPEETPRGGFGSGFVVDPKGVILTNYHVVAGADSVEVQLKDGRKFTSSDIHADRKTDLAIIRIHVSGSLPYLELGDSDAMDIGDRVLAVGAPFGLTGSVTAGIVSAKGRDRLNVNMYEDFIQTDAAINPGNSGGPLVNLEGRVIGINSAIKSRTGTWNGVGLAISSNLAKNVMQALEKGGVVHRGYLGIGIGELTPEVAAQLGIPNNQGVVVRSVFEGSPAAKAGIQPGDIITAVGGKPIRQGRELQLLVAGLPLHRPVELTVVRDGKSREMPVTIEEQPETYGTVQLPNVRTPQQEGEAVHLEKVGLEVKDLSAEAASQLGYKEGAAGVLISKVDPDSIAARAGLARGILITKVNQHEVRSAAALRTAIEKGSLEKGILLQVQAPLGGTNYVVLKAEGK